MLGNPPMPGRRENFENGDVESTIVVANHIVGGAM